MTRDILAIGDLTTDIFIRLKEAEVHDGQLCLKYGDKIPYESAETVRAVGNSSNASVAAARLRLSSALLSYMGNDRNGKECLEELHKNNVGTEYIRVEAGKHTNYHYVLWYDVDRTILVKHETFNYDLGEIEQPKWIYLSSLGPNSLPFHDQIADFLEKNKEVKLAFQPGTFQIKTGAEKLSRIYKRTNIFICNVDEAQEILNESSRDLPTLLRRISALGPKIVIITDGYAGAYAYDTNTGQMWFVPVYPHKPFERTGAGDAFASTTVAALAMGKSLTDALLWAPINAMSVTQFVGAQKGLLTREKIEDYLKKAPGDYKLKKI